MNKKIIVRNRIAIKRRIAQVRIAMLLSLLLIVAALEGCAARSTAHNLAFASNVASIGMESVQDAVELAMKNQQITIEERNAINAQIARSAQALLAVNQGIRGGLSAEGLRPLIQVYVDSANELINSGVAGIKNEEAKQRIKTAVLLVQSAISTVVVLSGGAS